MAVLLVATGAQKAAMAAEDGPDPGRPAKSVAADETAQAAGGSRDEASSLDALATGGGRVPPDVVQAAIQLGEDPQAESRVAAFLTSGNAFPRRMAGRALAIIRAARVRGALQSQAEVNQMADRVRGVARRAFNAPRVFKVTVTEDLVPPPGTIALDFGPSDGPNAAGFEPVSGRGDHLRGATLRFKRDPATANALMADGVAGVERLQAVVPNGTYHVILLTRQPPGPPALPPAPFGRELDAKQAVFPMGTAEPDTWYDRFVLANPVLSDAERQGDYQDLKRRLKGEEGAGTGPGRGAGISFKVEVTTGFITVDLKQHADTEDPIYLTGALIEPASRATVWMRPQAFAQTRTIEAFRDALGESDAERVAAATAYAIHTNPDAAEQIFTAAVQAYPEASQRIAAAVAGLGRVTEQQVVEWRRAVPGPTDGPGGESLARMPSGATSTANDDATMEARP